MILSTLSSAKYLVAKYVPEDGSHGIVDMFIEFIRRNTDVEQPEEIEASM